jgi:hypothetical protein
MPELSRSDKETARIIIDKGLQKEIENGINELDRLIIQWREMKTPNQDIWRRIYHTLKKHDKHIATRYDGLSGSRFDAVLASQLKEGIINPADLEGLEEEVKSTILIWSAIA